MGDYVTNDIITPMCINCISWVWLIYFKCYLHLTKHYRLVPKVSFLTWLLLDAWLHYNIRKLRFEGSNLAMFMQSLGVNIGNT